MSYIIVCRNPSNKKLIVVTNGDSDDVAEFDAEEKAWETAQTIACCRAWGAEIVPVDRE